MAPDTLRKWEQRYGVLRPQRTAGGQRRYTEQDAARVEWLRDRLAEGWRIGEAARVLQGTEAPAHATAGSLRDALASAARDGGPADAGAVLDQVFAVLPVEQALTDVIGPAMTEIGEAWHRGELNAAQEHAVTLQVRARLDQLIADARGGVRGLAVLACAPGEQHELGLLMLAVLLRADGWKVSYLGPNTPARDTLAYARQVEADVVCFSVARAETLERLAQELPPRVERQVPVAIGGGAATAAATRALGGRYLGAELTGAVTRLRELTRS